MEYAEYYEEWYKSNLIIGVGEFGCNVVAQMQCNPIAQTIGDSGVSYFNPSYLTVSSMKDSIQDDIVELIKDNNVDMVFVVCGMDGVTETAVAPVIAETSKKLGILTIGIVTNTLPFESQIYMEQAMSMIKKLRENADTIIVIPNEKLEDNNLDSGVQLIRKADEVCVQTIESFIGMICGNNIIGFDLKMLSYTLKSQGVASIARVGIGICNSCNSNEEMIDAGKAIVSGPLSDVNWKKVPYVSVNATTGLGIGLIEMEMLASYICDLAGIEADFLSTHQVEESLSDNVAKITLIIGQQC